MEDFELCGWLLAAVVTQTCPLLSDETVVDEFVVNFQQLFTKHLNLKCLTPKFTGKPHVVNESTFCLEALKVIYKQINSVRE